jgi:hypothetical protein
VLVQFIEVGGDHLDSLMSANKEVRLHIYVRTASSLC